MAALRTLDLATTEKENTKVQMDKRTKGRQLLSGHFLVDKYQFLATLIFLLHQTLEQYGGEVHCRKVTPHTPS